MPRITFVREYDLFSAYRRNDGTFVYLTHGEVMTPYVWWWDRDDAMAFWRTLQVTRDEFREFLRVTLDEPDMADEINWCNDCSEMEHQDEGSTVKGGDWVCDGCRDNHYSWCEDCEEYVPGDDMNRTLGDSSVCDSCLNRNYTWCESCDGYYVSSYSEDHDHDSGDGCCEAPGQSFRVPNDGKGLLWNDEVTTVTLPGGVISDQGMQQIKMYLRDEVGYDNPSGGYVFPAVDTVGATVQTKQGNFTKRLSRQIWKDYQVKVPSGVLSEIGNIASANSRAVDHRIAVTRDLNQSAREFGHSDSCWWQSYYKSRCTLKSNGGFGLRSFDENDRVTGRVWVMPLKLSSRDKQFVMPTTAELRNWAKNYGYTVADSGPIPAHLVENYRSRYERPPTLEPTFETENPDAWIVFNGYGNLSEYTPARIWAYMTGMTYRKIGFSAPDMYVNNGGYLIASEELAEKYTDKSLNLNIDYHSRLWQIEQTEKANAAAVLADAEQVLVNA